MTGLYSRYGKKYSPEENRQIITLLRRGCRPHQVGRKLALEFHRPKTAIADRVFRLRMDLDKKGQLNQILPIQTITKKELPDWYVLGWLPDQFDSETCSVYWSRLDDPIYPEGGKQCSSLS